ncbi:M20 family metallo-hydrolase [Auritidibacter ignavus]|uniref:M20 family metallo-hydrolase n=1 Tax=Auritidibacter ignavus TaxID=678932 RepID=UPI0024473A98|nr:M20 family metallo-hydrolase [Auritidibacter ignavus]WGH80855.1 M20 family metallo-hydrolase [Auritidibacter ignavus]WGH90074.1 M20 family metallo-hydrolase [Auritidibacter ignavus]WHS36093.1 M20 family metallo-hydrolase [Auritidibacter ignavus]
MSEQRDFLRDFHTMSSFGATAGGGVDRQAGTSEDLETRSWLREVFAETGLTEVQDQIGNQFGVAELIPGAPYLLVGSHLDSQPLAGRLDGAYGVLCAVHAVHNTLNRLRAEGKTPAMNLAVVNWFNEEGSRFTPSMMGSSVYTGKMDLSDALATSDRNQVTVSEALQDEKVQRVEQGPEAAAYAEIHIEQGRNLENSGNTIGLVHATWGAKKFQVTLTGEQGHTGSTLMADRQDALYGAALMITAAHDVTEQFDEGLLHSSVAQLSLEPNSPVTLAREVVMNLDLRSPDSTVLEQAQHYLEEQRSTIEQRARVEIAMELTHSWDLNPYPSQGVELAREVAEGLELSHQEVMTVAGHDSTNMKDSVPTVMLFVPSIEGISHNEKESTTDEDMVAGAQMLSEVVYQMVTGSLASEAQEES